MLQSVERKSLKNHVGSNSVAVGYGAGYYTTGSYNTFIGRDAGKGGTTSAPYSSGQNNVAIGYQSFYINRDSNVAIGRIAAGSVQRKWSNTAVGSGHRF